MRRISPAPRRKPAAFEKVGAAVTAVAANAPKRHGGYTPVELSISMLCFVLYVCLARDVTQALSSSSPDATIFYAIRVIVNQA